MKKALAVLLSIVMLLSALPMVSFSAQEKEYVFMDVNWGYEVKITDDEPVLYYAFTAEKSGYYSFYSFCGDDDPYVHCYDENHNELGFDDNSGFGYNFAYNKYLEEGKTYYFEIGAEYITGDYARFGIEVRDISSSITEMKLDEDYLIQTKVDYDREYFSFTPEEDGYYAFMSNYAYPMDTDAVMYDSNWNYLSEDDCSGGICEFSLPYYLKAGETYYYTTLSDYYMMKESYIVRIWKTAPILDIKVESYPDKMTYYNGYIEDTVDFSGLELELTDSNGKVYHYKYDEDTYVPHTAVYLDLLKDENGRYYISIDAGLAHEEIDVKITDCPITSIEVYSASEVNVYENTSGFYNHVKDGEEYFEYIYKLPNDLKIQINYEEGPSVVTSFFEVYDGMKFRYSDDQYEQHWKLGQNPVKIKYYDKECNFYVNVCESLVDYFTVETAPTKQYVYSLSGTDPVEGDYCEFMPDLNGIVFTAHNKDGTTEVFYDYDLENYWSYNSFKMDPHRVYGPGKTKITFTYCNREVSFDADVVLGVGDCDGNGVVTVMDATQIQRHIAKLDTIPDDILYCGDTDRDTKVTINDATRIQRYIAHYIDKL